MSWGDLKRIIKIDKEKDAREWKNQEKNISELQRNIGGRIHQNDEE
jgi:hypothetical protein